MLCKREVSLEIKQLFGDRSMVKYLCDEIPSILNSKATTMSYGLWWFLGMSWTEFKDGLNSKGSLIDAMVRYIWAPF